MRLRLRELKIELELGVSDDPPRKSASFRNRLCFCEGRAEQTTAAGAYGLHKALSTERGRSWFRVKPDIKESGRMKNLLDVPAQRTTGARHPQWRAPLRFLLSLLDRNGFRFALAMRVREREKETERSKKKNQTEQRFCKTLFLSFFCSLLFSLFPSRFFSLSASYSFPLSLLRPKCLWRNRGGKGRGRATSGDLSHMQKQRVCRRLSLFFCLLSLFLSCLSGTRLKIENRNFQFSLDAQTL